MKKNIKSWTDKALHFFLYGVAFTSVSFVYHSIWGSPYDQTIPRASADTPPDPWIIYTTSDGDSGGGTGGGACDGGNNPGSDAGSCSDTL
jgi:hypothetical protein